MIPELALTAPQRSNQAGITTLPAASRRGCVSAQEAVDIACWTGTVLPMVRFSRFLGYPVISWTGHADKRLHQGWGPELDRSTLSLWEAWPDEIPHPPPEPAVRIIGFVSAATWRPGMQAARELCGYGAGMVFTRHTPSALRLAEADLAGVWVVRGWPSGEVAVLVRGRPGRASTARRVVATRYWEEFLFAHALKHGLVPICPPSRA